MFLDFHFIIEYIQVINNFMIFIRVTYPNTLSEVLVADQHQRVMLRFVVRDTASGRPTEVHQAFVKITHVDSKREIIFVADTDANDVYKFDIVSHSTKLFDSCSHYSVKMHENLAMFICTCICITILFYFFQDVSNSMKDFGGVSGVYSLELIIGDASISNPTLWHLTDLSLTFPEASGPTQPQDYTYKVIRRKPYLFCIFSDYDKFQVFMIWIDIYNSAC